MCSTLNKSKAHFFELVLVRQHANSFTGQLGGVLVDCRQRERERERERAVERYRGGGGSHTYVGPISLCSVRRHFVHTLARTHARHHSPGAGWNTTLPNTHTHTHTHTRTHDPVRCWCSVEHPNCNMAVVNRLVWQSLQNRKIPFFIGAPLTSPFNGYKDTSDYYVIHK